MFNLNPIVSTIQDLFILITPTKKSHKTYKFAFIVHPRSHKDLERKFPFFKYIPRFVKIVFTNFFWPITLSKITGLRSVLSGEQIEGYIISILPTAHYLVNNRKIASRRIMQACILAKKKGAKIIGLGGLTSSLSKGGLDLLDKIDIKITTGHAYTSYNIIQNIHALMKYMELDKKKIYVGIVGAAGSIGSTSAKLLAREGFSNIILIDTQKKESILEKLVSEINTTTNIITSNTAHDIKKCDIIIAATNAPEAIIKSKDLKCGAIVVDDAQPSDVHSEVFNRKDVLVIEAGVTHTPNINSNFNFGLKNKHDNFCCLAELLILSAHEWSDHYVINRASIESVNKIADFGNRLNFKIGAFQNFHELITEEKMSYIKKVIHENDLKN